MEQLQNHRLWHHLFNNPLVILFAFVFVMLSAIDFQSRWLDCIGELLRALHIMTSRLKPSCTRTYIRIMFILIHDHLLCVLTLNICFVTLTDQSGNIVCELCPEFKVACNRICKHILFKTKYCLFVWNCLTSFDWILTSEKK